MQMFSKSINLSNTPSIHFAVSKTATTYTQQFVLHSPTNLEGWGSTGLQCLALVARFDEKYQFVAHNDSTIHNKSSMSDHSREHSSGFRSLVSLRSQGPAALCAPSPRSPACRQATRPFALRVAPGPSVWTLNVPEQPAASAACTAWGHMVSSPHSPYGHSTRI